MVDVRSRRLVRCVINGVTIQGALEEYMPPEVEKQYEEAKGGRFVPDEILAGLSVGRSSYKLTGISVELLATMGVSEGELVESTVMISVEDENGAVRSIRHEESGRVVSVKEDAIKPGVEGATLEFSPRAYKRSENGAVSYDIDRKTQKCVVGGRDLLLEHRQAVDLP